MQTALAASMTAPGEQSLIPARIDWCLDRLGRLCVAILFIDAARYHISSAGWTRTLNDMHARGVPAAVPLLVVAMIASTLLALALLFGFRERWAALGLAIYTISVSSVMYNPFANLGQASFILFLKDLCIFGALLALSRALNGRRWPTALAADDSSSRNS